MAVTHKSLQLKIERCTQLIEDYEQRIASYQESIKNQQAEINKVKKLQQDLENYEAQPISSRTLYAYIDSTTKTVDLFDYFESTNKQGFQKFARLIFLRSEIHHGNWFYYIIERLQTDDYEGDITATEFKRGETYRLRQYANAELDRISATDELYDGQVIIFEKPFHFRAQNSMNRTGYGNIYEGEDLIYEGTLYGETTDYAVVGILVEDYTFSLQRHKNLHYY